MKSNKFSRGWAWAASKREEVLGKLVLPFGNKPGWKAWTLSYDTFLLVGARGLA